MPVLQNPSHEAFAKARSGGARLEDAYEDAGFAPDSGHACRLAKRPEVAERIAELRREREDTPDAGPEAIIAALMRLAKAAETDTTPGAVKEARLNLIEADRLRQALHQTREFDRGRIRHEIRFNRVNQD